MYDVIIAAGGKSLRAKQDKLVASLGESTVLSRTVGAFLHAEGVQNVIVATDLAYDFDGVLTVPAGATRAESVRNALAACTAPYVLVHDGARPFVTRDLIIKVASDTETFGSSVPFLPVTDSLRLVKGGAVSPVDRNDYVTLQTPQGFGTDDLRRAYALATEGDLCYDDSELYAKYVRPIHLTPGEPTNKKITFPEDVTGYNARVGAGYDVHRYVRNGRPLTLGGVRIPYEQGVDAHSDGDVVIHAVMDALLNAANERDIGVLFPDDDPAYDNADSRLLLQRVQEILTRKNVRINNVSVTIIAQAPKLKDYIPEMSARLSSLLDLAPTQVSLNATTTEGLGVVGEKKGIAVLALASVF